MRKDTQVSFSLGSLDLSNTCALHTLLMVGTLLQPQTNQLKVSLALLVHDIQYTVPEA